MLKNDILNLITIRDITNKYGIKIVNNMCKCPFGHNDSSPSMKIYDKTNSFYCFACHSSGDVIKFVQLLYGLNFQKAMEKINDDFQLGLSTKSTYNKEQILKLEREKKIKEYQQLQLKERENKYFVHISKIRRIYEDIIKSYKRQINVENWEDIQLAINYCRKQLRKIDEYIYDKYGII